MGKVGQPLRDTVGLVVRGDLARQREVVHNHGAQHIMEAMAWWQETTPSIRLERTDARVGL